MEFLWCQVTKALCKDLRMFFLGGKILFCKEPVAIEVSGAVGRLRVSPSRWIWVSFGEFGGEGRYLRKVEQVQGGVSPSAQRVANSLWLQRLSMTEGFLVKTTAVEGD